MEEPKARDAPAAGPGADLSGADLRDRVLRGAELARARFVGADLRGANLRDADLREADFTDAVGLLEADLAGSDLTGAIVPDAVAAFPRLGYLQDASGIARPMFRGLLVACVFTLLTIGSTTDTALLANQSLQLLPGLSAPIPARSWFWAAPIALAVLFLYLHLHLAGIFEALSRLPAIFPDGMSVEKKTRPWLVLGLVRLRDGARPSGVRSWVAAFLVWGAVPTTLLIFWARYLRLHDTGPTLLHIALIVACTLGASASYLRSAAILARDPHRFDDRSVRRRLAGGGVALALMLVAGSLAVVQHPLAFAPWRGNARPKHVRALVPDLVKASFEHPPRLVKRNLSFANGYRAAFREADLRDAWLVQGHFQRADFQRSELEYACAVNLNADSADFSGACLRGADLRGADLQHADFRGAYLGKADLSGAEAEGADFRGANLQGAQFVGADLTDATFDGAFLGCAVFHRKDAEKRSVQCADFTDATLARTWFGGAELENTVGLEREPGHPKGRPCGAPARAEPGIAFDDCEPDAVLGRNRSEEPRPPAAANPCAQEAIEDRWRPLRGLVRYPEDARTTSASEPGILARLAPRNCRDVVLREDGPG